MSLNSYVHATLAGEDALVFAFHGTGGDERQFLPPVRSIWPRAEIVAPRGDVSEQGGLRFFRRSGEGVYDFDDLARRTATMAAFVGAHKARAGQGRTIGVGYSNGANILTSVALAEPGLFDDVALLHPLIPWRPRDDSRLVGTRALITAGRRDPICPARETQALADFWLRQGPDMRLEWHEGGHELRDSEVAALTKWNREAVSPPHAAKQIGTCGGVRAPGCLAPRSARFDARISKASVDGPGERFFLSRIQRWLLVEVQQGLCDRLIQKGVKSVPGYGQIEPARRPGATKFAQMVQLTAAVQVDGDDPSVETDLGVGLRVGSTARRRTGFVGGARRRRPRIGRRTQTAAA